MLLLKIREKTISYSCYKKKCEREKELNLEREIKQMTNNVNNDTVRELEILKSQLQELREKKIQGMIVRSRMRWAQDGEKPSKYFCNLESRNFVDKSMHFLERENGDLIFEQEDVLCDVHNFYQQLYANRNVTDVKLDSLLHDVDKLSHDESISLEGLLTYQEICQALRTMKNNKSPGSDGFTVEFFKFFINDLGLFLTRSINDGFCKGSMSVTQRQGVIICIPKDNKPKQHLKNWRPISLLNISYKIASASIANRIKSVLPKIICDDQKGFMRGRYIGENIRKIYDVMQYAEVENIPGMLLTVDCEKAFDSVSWFFLHKALRFFNFGPDIINWIHTFYNNITSCVSVNGQYSKWFSIGRGVRQGDPCSPYLYLICAEVLSAFIRQNNKIRGIKLKAHEVLLSQFADDTSLCLDGSEESFRECIRVLKLFAEISGLKINNDKTNVVWIGSMKNSEVRYMRDENFCWNPGIFKVLGVLFSTDIQRMVDINFEGKLQVVHKLIHYWNKRQLTPLGKITVIKSLILSKFTYLFLNLPDPPIEFTKELQNILYRFLWNGKPAKIKRSVVCKSYIDGGLQMVDVQTFISSLKISWVQRYRRGDGLQKFLFELYPEFENLTKLGEDYVNICMKHCDNYFWLDVLKHFKQLSLKCRPANISEFMAECIHYNVNIIRDNRIVIVKEWIQHGILFINQLFNVEKNNFLTFAEFQELYPNLHQTNFLLYTGIIHAIEQYRVKYNFELTSHYRVLETKVWMVVLGGSKKIQSVFLASDISPTAVKKWNMVFHDLRWKDIFSCCFQFQDVKLKWFQARVLHRLLPTKKFLYDCRITDDPTCTFCTVDVQTIQHLLWRCEIVQTFWGNVQAFLNKCDHCNLLVFSEELILFGVKHNVQTDKGLDLILVLAKFHIYKCYMNNTKPNLRAFILMLNSNHLEMKAMAKINGKLTQFNQTWFPFQPLLQQ